MLKAVQLNQSCFAHAQDDLRLDVEFSLEAISRNGMDLKFVSSGLTDREMVFRADQLNGFALRGANFKF